jgi:uncharacterized damage-inducible protein DinB
MTGYGATELATAFRGVRKNTLQIAQDIPEDKYDFVAAPGVQTVSEMLRHIAFGPMLYVDMHAERRVTTLKGYDFAGAIGRSSAEEKKPRNKAEIIALLTAEGERFASWLESLSPEFLAETFTDPMGQSPRTRFESLLSPKEHEMHHRGQLMLIERMLGHRSTSTRQRQRVLSIRRRLAPASRCLKSAIMGGARWI